MKTYVEMIAEANPKLGDSISTLLASIDGYSDRDRAVVATDGMRGVFQSKLEEATGRDDADAARDDRYLFTETVFGVQGGSAKSLTQAQCHASVVWLQNGGAALVPAIMVAAQRVRGQQELLMVDPVVEAAVELGGEIINSDERSETMSEEKVQEEQVLENEVQHQVGEPPWQTYSEAPASLNAYCITKGGWHVQITLRDTDEGRLWNRFVKYANALTQKAGVVPKAIGKGNGYDDSAPARQAASHPGNVEQRGQPAPQPAAETNPPAPPSPPTTPQPSGNGGNGSGGNVEAIDKVLVTAPKGQPQVEFWRTGRKYPELKWNLGGESLLKIAPSLAQAGWMAEHFDTVGGDYQVSLKVHWEPSAKNPKWKDITNIELA